MPTPPIVEGACPAPLDRSAPDREPRHFPPQRLVERYRRKFALSASMDLTEAMVMEHWELERRLTAELLAATPDQRAQVFERCYGELFRRCPWLNRRRGDDDAADWRDFRHILSLLGPARDVFEIGSGHGRLAEFLARQGLRCVATEITTERGPNHLPSPPNLFWRVCDGVRLTRFEAPASYDAVLSTHVVEHLHPDDVLLHFQSAAALLRPGGRYVLAMPHRFAGPMDLSSVFGLEEACCMHLKEYTWRETTELFAAAGFARVEAAWVAPRALRSHAPAPIRGRGLLVWLRTLEALLAPAPSRHRRRLARAAGLLLFRPEILAVAHKSG